MMNLLRFATSFVCLVGLVFPHVVRAQDPSAALKSARILADNKDYDGAMKIAKDVLANSPESAEAVYVIAFCDDKLGNTAQAIEGYNKYLKLSEQESSSPAARDLRTKAEASLTRLDEGKRVCLKYAAMMEQEAAKIAAKNEAAAATIRAAAVYLRGGEVDSAASAAVESKRHPKDAISFGGHWYKAIDEPSTWHQAKASCEKMGGRLVCIVKGKASFWIGANDEAVEGDWRWLEGKPLRYAAWVGKEPGNTNENEHHACLRAETGHWNDFPAGKRFHFICEWEK